MYFRQLEALEKVIECLSNIRKTSPRFFTLGWNHNNCSSLVSPQTSIRTGGWLRAFVFAQKRDMCLEISKLPKLVRVAIRRTWPSVGVIR